MASYYRPDYQPADASDLLDSYRPSPHPARTRRLSKMSSYYRPGRDRRSPEALAARSKRARPSKTVDAKHVPHTLQPAVHVPVDVPGPVPFQGTISLDADPRRVYASRRTNGGGFSLGHLTILQCEGRTAWRNSKSSQYFYNAARIYWRLGGQVPAEELEQHNLAFLDATFNELRVIRNLFSENAYSMLDRSDSSVQIILFILADLYWKHWHEWTKFTTEEEVFKDHVRIGGQLEGFYNNITEHGAAKQQWTLDLASWARELIFAGLPQPCMWQPPQALVHVKQKREPTEEVTREESPMPANYGDFGQHGNNAEYGRWKLEARAYELRPKAPSVKDVHLSSPPSNPSQIISAEADRLIAEFGAPPASTTPQSSENAERSLVPYTIRPATTASDDSSEEYLKIHVRRMEVTLHQHPGKMQDPEAQRYWREVQDKAEQGLWCSYWRTVGKLEGVVGAPLRGHGGPTERPSDSF